MAADGGRFGGEIDSMVLVRPRITSTPSFAATSAVRQGGAAIINSLQPGVWLELHTGWRGGANAQ
jgi:hypothetical protein